MPKVEIFVNEGYGDCDDCGTYMWEEIKVLKDDEELVLEHRGDDHLGGGVWYEWQPAVAEILTALGFEVKITRVEGSA